MAGIRSKVTFESNGVQLAGLLQSPQYNTRGYAIFAHCFTCGKDAIAASRISRQLVELGFAVLRFDFTGLGNSDGDFANANFSSNVEDLVAAADFLRHHYEAPLLLVGHSLGGRAILSAAHQMDEVQAVVTIGAPADAAHITRQFASHVDEIQASGEVDVKLAGRCFTIKRQFLDDVAKENDDIEQLRKPLLILHSPVDEVVSIAQAEAIYTRAKHPKSFVCLDNADHLLTDKSDAAYAARVIAAWSEKYLPVRQVLSEGISEVPKGEVEVAEYNRRFTRLLTTDHHQWYADEPAAMGGDNLGPDPYEHLLGALGACTSMTLRMYANRKKIPLDDVLVSLRHSRQHGADCEHCDQPNARVELLERELVLKGNLTPEQRQLLVAIADKCPVHKTLLSNIVIVTRLAGNGSA
jgi:putative redox protein